MEDVDLFSVASNFAVVDFLSDLEDVSVLVKDLAGCLLGQPFESIAHLAGLPSKNPELLALKNEFELSALTNKSVKERSALFNKTFFLVSEDLLLWDAGNKAPRPSSRELYVQNVEFVITTDDFKLALRVLASHSVLYCVSNSALNFLRVRYAEEVSGVFFILKTSSFSCAR